MSQQQSTREARRRFDTAPFEARGPVSTQLLWALQHPADDADETLNGLLGEVTSALAATGDILRDDDLQVSLLVLYGLHYASVVDCDEHWEWQPTLVAARLAIERVFEARLRECVDRPALPEPDAEAVASALFALTSADSGPSLSRYIAKRATAEQLVEYVVLRSVYNLKEADPHSWAIPRLTGRAKVAMVEIQADEYGGGRPERMHSTIWAGTMRGMGLDDRYGTYVDNAPAIVLASFNLMSMFGINRRLRGAITGHLAAYEMTSSVPCRLVGNGFRRLGHGPDVTWYFDEHVEADAVHEQIAGRDLAGGLAEEEPTLLADIFFGANAYLTVDGWASEAILDAWSAGRSALRQPLEIPDAVGSVGSSGSAGSSGARDD